MKKLLFKLPSIIFSCIEAFCIFLCGICFKLQYTEIISIIVVFVLTRMTAHSPCHYKSLLKCFLWTMLVFCSFFLVVKVNIVISIIVTIFAGYILTENGNIQDSFMYRRKEDDKKYRELKKYVDTYKNTKQIEKFENKIINFNEKFSDRYKINIYEIYKLIFYENMSYEKVKKTMNLRDDNHIITNALDMVFICFNTFIETEKDKELAEIS